MKYADAPGTPSSAAEINPPAADSATATVCFRALSAAPIFSARGISSRILSPLPFVKLSTPSRESAKENNSLNAKPLTREEIHQLMQRHFPADDPLLDLRGFADWR